MTADRHQPDQAHALATLPLAQVVARCEGERRRYQAEGILRSPACVELFRRAFANDEAAWAALRATFEPLVRSWVGTQRRVEADDVVQETWLAFARYAPRHGEMVADDELGRVLAFLRRCTKTALLTLLRRHPPAEDLDNYEPTSAPPADDAALRAALRERLALLLVSEEERRAFFWRFECNMRPQQIVAEYGAYFSDVAALYDIIQRITRRLRKDPVLRELYGSPSPPRQKPDGATSLEMRIGIDEGRSMQDEQCTLSDTLLLDYVTGVIDAEGRAAVERLPACLAAARLLAADLRPLLRAVYRQSCPRSEELVAYSEGRLASTAQLVVRAHATLCPHCGDELALLATMDALPLVPPAGPLRRVVTALLQPALTLPQPLRGGMLHYTTPHLLINLHVRRSSHGPTWTLRGQIRTPDGQQAPTLLEDALLHPTDDADARQEGRILPGGSFVFANLPDGRYTLLLLTADEEVVVRSVVVP